MIIEYSQQATVLFPVSWRTSARLNYLLNQRSTVLLEKLTGSQLVKKFPAFHGTRRFITAFTSSRHLSLSWASSIQSIPPHPTSWRSILILSSHLSLSLPSGLLHSGFPTKTLYKHFLCPIWATCPAHLMFLPQCERPSFTPIKNNRQNYSSVYPLLHKQ